MMLSQYDDYRHKGIESLSSWWIIKVIGITIW